LLNTFSTEIGTSNIFCISYDEANQEIWFGLSNKIKKFNIKREIWSEPLNERTGSDLIKNSDISEIITSGDYIWVFSFNCNIIYYNKLRDIWREWKPSSNIGVCNYLSFVDEDANYIWIKSDLGIWQYNKKNNEWYDFDVANYLSDKTIRKVLLDDNKNFWIETNEEIGYYERQKNVWEIHKKSAFPAKNRNGVNYLNSIYTIAKDNDIVWLSTETGLLKYNLNSKVWTIFDKKKINDEYKTDFTYFGSIYIDSYYIWLGTDQGLFRIAQ